MSEKENILGKRIKDRRIELSKTQGEIAKEIGVATSTIQRYEAASIGKIKLPVVEAIARVLNVSPEWLIGKSDIKDSGYREGHNYLSVPNIMPLPKTKKVPRLGTIACGEPILAEENIESYDQAPEGVNCDFTLRCKGDSMIGARINDGDIVYVRQQKEVENGEIAAVLIDDCAESSATLKRVYLYDNQIVLQAENPKYPPIVFAGEEMNRVRIIGRAVAFLSNVK